MAKVENDIANQVRIACGKLGIKLWRNMVGYDDKIQRPYGLKKGSADWIGVMPLVIQPHHIGQVVGVFVSIETKTLKGKMSPDGTQDEWLENRLNDGCIALVARRPEDVPDPQKWQFPRLK